jgi:hypothetical protein
MDSQRLFHQYRINRRGIYHLIQLSVQDFGCCCYYSSFGGIKFLLKLSVRVDNVISLQALSCREVLENEVDFI